MCTLCTGFTWPRRFACGVDHRLRLGGAGSVSLEQTDIRQHRLSPAQLALPAAGMSSHGFLPLVLAVCAALSALHPCDAGPCVWPYNEEAASAPPSVLLGWDLPHQLVSGMESVRVHCVPQVHDDMKVV